MIGGTESVRQVAGELLRIGAVRFATDEPFTFASGMKSPMYCDNRLTMAHPEVRDLITRCFTEQVASRHLVPDTIVAVATAGIAPAAWLAHHLRLPLAYVRGKAKDHGRRRKVEGELNPGQRTVVVEDLVTTGGSALDAVAAVREATGVVPLAVLCIFTYNHFGVCARFAAAGSPLVPLCTLNQLLDHLQARLPPGDAVLDALWSFQRDPGAWGRQHIEKHS